MSDDLRDQLIEAGLGPEPFFQKLERRVEGVNSLLCVGIDPHPEDLVSMSIDHFVRRMLDQTYKFAAAFKFNSAFFEVLGPVGMQALQQGIRYAQMLGVPTILDAKRGDIQSTSEIYAQAAFETYEADAVTVSPYVGFDALEPFLRRPYQGAFVLARTSELDTALQNARYVATRVRDYHNAGLVVAAMHPEDLSNVREVVPDAWILCPGFGAQGGHLDYCLYLGLRKDQSGMLISASRSIARADSPREAAKELRDRINAYRSRKHWLAQRLLDGGCVKFGSFRLKDGSISPIYIDLRVLPSTPRLCREVVQAMWSAVDEDQYLYAPERNVTDNYGDFDCLAAIPTGGLVLGALMSQKRDMPMVYPRMEVKEYGTKSRVEGLWSKYDRALLVDDVISSGETKLQAINALYDSGINVNGIVVLLDRRPEPWQRLTKLDNAGPYVHSVFKLREFVTLLLQEDMVPPAHIEAVKEYVSDL